MSSTRVAITPRGGRRGRVAEARPNQRPTLGRDESARRWRWWRLMVRFCRDQVHRSGVLHGVVVSSCTGAAFLCCVRCVVPETLCAIRRAGNLGPHGSCRAERRRHVVPSADVMSCRKPWASRVMSCRAPRSHRAGRRHVVPETLGLAGYVVPSADVMSCRVSRWVVSCVACRVGCRKSRRSVPRHPVARYRLRRRVPRAACRVPCAVCRVPCAASPCAACIVRRAVCARVVALRSDGVSRFARAAGGGMRHSEWPNSHCGSLALLDRARALRLSIVGRFSTVPVGIGRGAVRTRDRFERRIQNDS
jgi:hypothetical protein